MNIGIFPLTSKRPVERREFDTIDDLAVPLERALVMILSLPLRAPRRSLKHEFLLLVDLAERLDENSAGVPGLTRIMGATQKTQVDERGSQPHPPSQSAADGQFPSCSWSAGEHIALGLIVTQM